MNRLYLKKETDNEGKLWSFRLINQTIDDNYEAVRKDNRLVISWVNGLCISMMVLLLIASLLLDYLRSFSDIYLAFALVLISNALLLYFVANKHSRVVDLCFYITTVAIYAFGIIIGVFMNADINANMIMVFLIVMPSLFFEKPLRSILLTILTTLALCVLSYIFKPLERFQTDATNGVSSCVISIVMMLIINRMRAKYYLSRRRLKEINNTDELTGLPNRRHFNAYIQDHLNDIKDSDKHVCAMLVDVDCMQEFNDFYGHLTGDDCICSLAKLFKSFAAEHDVFFARFGGDKFIVVLINSKEDLMQLANALVEQVRDFNLPNTTSEYGIITVSVGCVDADSLAIKNDIKLINAADEALSLAKTKGKNRAELYVKY